MFSGIVDEDRGGGDRCSEKEDLGLAQVLGESFDFIYTGAWRVVGRELICVKDDGWISSGVLLLWGYGWKRVVMVGRLKEEARTIGQECVGSV